MSMVAQVMEGIKIAKANLGDLLLSATLKHKTGETYVGGTYTPTEDDVPIQIVIDQFTFEDRQMEDFRESDLKVSVFNNDAQDLVIDFSDKILLNGVRYDIVRLEPQYVGTVKAVYEVVLRK